MSTSPTERYLAAILFTDIAGYTATMQKDEDKALSQVRKHQITLEELVQRHGGSIYQYYGDGSLSIFTSARNALECALNIQKKMLTDPVVPLRIGLHIGEVFWQDEKLYGDGLNISARILALGQPGTVFFSSEFYDKIKNIPQFQSHFLGSYDLKNVEKPVEVYALSHPEIQAPDLRLLKNQKKPAVTNRTWKRSLVILPLILVAGILVYFNSKKRNENSGFEELEKSVAVLPFENVNQDQENDHLTWGFTEDLLTHLSRIDHLKVIARTSSIRYKDSTKPLKKIASELDVTHLIQGSVRSIQNKLRISIQLVDPFHNDRVQWADDFDFELSDVLRVQREVAIHVSKQLQVELNTEKTAILSGEKKIHPEAYQSYQRGQMLLRSGAGTASSLDSAENHFRKALTFDPRFELIYIGLADTYLEKLFWHRGTGEEMLVLARDMANKAMELNPNLGECYGILGSIELYSNNLSIAEKYLQRAIDLSPGYLPASERLVWIELYKGNIENCFRLIDKICTLDPLSSRYRGALSQIYYYLRDFDKGVEFLREFTDKFGKDNFILWTEALLYAGKGNYQKAIELLNQRTIGADNWMLGYSYAKSGDRAKAEMILENNLEKAKSQHVPDYMIAVQYLALKDYENALNYLEKSLSVNDQLVFTWFLDVDIVWDELRDNQRFLEIVRKSKQEITAENIHM